MQDLAVSKLTDYEWLHLERMQDSTILITGGTGLIGFSLIHELSGVIEKLNLKILVLVRDKERAQTILADYLPAITLIEGDVMDYISINEPLHYIIHCASITASLMFVEKPVETILTSVLGVRNMLELAARKQIRSMVYLSSMEVYGFPQEEKLLTEDALGYLNPLNVRSSYPESKRMSEALCVAYGKEYGVNVSIARLAQTFGPGIQSGDRRAIVQFVGSALNGTDIQIKTSGASARMYLYTFDAVTALLTILLNGHSGSAYNVADKRSYCSIAELARQIVSIFGSNSRVLLETGTEAERQAYPLDSFLRLDVSALEALGWKPCYTLQEGLVLFGEYLKSIQS